VVQSSRDHPESGGDTAGDGDTAGGAACSFAADTAVATLDGERAIGSLQVGDQVTAYDPATGKTSAQAMEHVWVNHDADLLDVTLTSDDKGAQATAAADGRGKAGRAAAAAHGAHAPPTTEASTATHSETVHTTEKHPWLTADRGWVAAGQLAMGRRMVREGGGTARRGPNPIMNGGGLS